MKEDKRMTSCPVGKEALSQSGYARMLELVTGLPKQLTAAEAIARQVDLGPRCDSRYVIVAGMGGSGIGAELVGGLVANKAKFVVVPCRDYSLPNVADSNSLCFVVSYSGNTEETLSAFADARRRRCRIVAITSGGRLAELAKKARLPVILVPSGLPPRAALGYLFAPLVVALQKLGLYQELGQELNRAADLLSRRQKSLHRKAKLIADCLRGQFPLVYSTTRLLDGVAERWRCQLNENAKVMCHTSSLPEHNHNEIVGMGRPIFLARHSVIVALLDSTTHPRTRQRLKHLLDIARGTFRHKFLVEITSGSELFRMLSLIMLGDLVSVELALRLGVDPMPVARIDELKRRMSLAKR